MAGFKKWLEDSRLDPCEVELLSFLSNRNDNSRATLIRWLRKSFYASADTSSCSKKEIWNTAMMKAKVTAFKVCADAGAASLGDKVVKAIMEKCA